MDGFSIEEVVARIESGLAVDNSAEARERLYAAERKAARIAALSLDRVAGWRLRLALEEAIAAIHRQRTAENDRDRSVVAQFRGLLPASVASDPGPPETELFAIERDILPRAYVAGPLGVRRVRTVASLWMLGFKADISSDRLGWIWWLLDPILHVLVVTVLAVFLHNTTIYDMPAFPFAIIGVVIWLIFRTTVFALMFWGGPLVNQISHPPIRYADVLFVRSARMAFVNICVGAVLMVLAIAIGEASLPRNPIRFGAALFLAWMFAIGIGLICGSLQLRYNGSRRIIVLLIRGLAIISGLFFVSEQLPQQLSRLVLWNPLLQAVQLARSAWFVEYETTDAQWSMIILPAMLALLIGLMCLVTDNRQRSRLV